MKMNEKYKKLWVAALRGQSPLGTYVQNVSGWPLCMTDRTGAEHFSSLGVLQNEVEGFYGDVAYNPGEPIQKTYEGTREGHLSFLDEATLTMVGLTLRTIHVHEMELHNTPFVLLADWIEENL